MATDNVVDRLSIEINADAKKAADSLDKLINKLNGLRAATSGLTASSVRITDIANSLRGLSGVKLDNLSRINNQLTKLGQHKFDNARNIESMAWSLQNLASVNVKDTGISSFVSAMARLAKVQIQPETAQRLIDIGNSLSAFSNTSDISSSVTKLISALAKLANASASIKIVTTELPNFGEAVRKVATSLSQLGGVNPLITQFVRSLAQLASSGDKMLTSAQNLGVFGNALRQLITTLNGANINQNVANLVSAIAQLSASMATLGKGGSTSAVVSSNTKLNRSFKDLEKVVKKVANSILDLFKKMARGIVSSAKEIIAKISGMKSATTSMFTVADGIKSVIGGLLGMRGITGAFNWLKEAVTAGGDITEINHIVESVFEKDMVDSVNTWAKNAISQFGIAEGAAKHYAGVLSSMFQASGIARRTAGEMSMDLVGIAADLSAFYNIDTETAYQKIKSGMAGMVRPLRDLGIDLSVASLQEYALTQGITKSVSAMTQAEKVMLRYNYLLYATQIQSGDFQRTQDSLANSLRTLKALAQSVATQIGVGLAAALRHVIIFLREAMKYVLGLAQTFANFMQTLFGKYSGGASGVVMEGLGDADDYANDLADATGDAASGLGDAADNAEQLRKELSVLPFDELNQLNKDREATTSSGGNGGTGGSGGGGLGDLGLGDMGLDLEDALETSKIPEAIQKWALRIRNAFLSHNWMALGRDVAQMFNEGLQYLYDLLDPEKVKEKVFPWIWAFAGTFNSFVHYFNFELLGRTLGRGLNDITMIFNEWYHSMNFTELGQGIASGINGMIDEIDFRQLGNALGNKFMIAWDIFAGLVSRLNWRQIGTKLADGISGLNESIRFGEIGITLAQLANGLFDALKAFTSRLPWGEIVANITNGITNFISKFHWTANGESLGLFINRLFITLRDFIDDLPMSEFGTKLANFVSSAIKQINFANITLALSRFIHQVFNLLNAFMQNMNWELFGEKIGEAIKGIDWKTIAEDIIEFIGNAEILKYELIAGLMHELIVEPIQTYFSGKIQELEDAGGDITGGILYGIAKGFFDINTWIMTNILDVFITAFKSVFMIGSPSKVMMTYGGYIIDGLLEGMKTAFVTVTEWFEELPSKIETAMGDPRLMLVSPGAAIIGSLIGGMESKDADVDQSVTETSGKITSGFSMLSLLSPGSSIIGTLVSGMKTQEANLQTEVDTQGNIITSKFKETENEADKYGTSTPWRYGHGFHNTQELTTNLDGMKGKIANTASQIQTDAIAKGNATVSGYGKSWANRADLNAQLSAMQQHIGSTVSNIQTAVLGFGRNTISGYGSQFRDRTELNNQLNSTQTDVNTKFDAIKQAAEDIGTNTRKGIEVGMQTHLINLRNITDDMLGVAEDTVENISNIMSNMDLYYAGQSAAQSFANGMQSVYVPTPHIFQSGYDFDFFGDGGWFTIPTYSVGWWKSGGLFKGGKGQVIGVAEGGRDEAVLPLEDKRAMSRIADSIVDSSGSGMGMNADDIADAVVHAMVMMQGNQQNPVFHIEVKTEDNEVLARAVTKGQQSIDYRNNPTPKFAY